MRAKSRSTLSARTVKLKVRDARDAAEEDPEVELVAVPEEAAHEAAVATTESSQREIAHLRKKEPTTMVLTLEAMAKQLTEEAREREPADPEEVLMEKKPKMTRRTEHRTNTPEGMEQEQAREEDATRPTTTVNLKNN